MQTDKSMQAGSYPDQPPPYVGPPPPGQPGPPPAQPYGPTMVQATMIPYPTVVPVVIGQQISPNTTRMTCRSCNIEIMTRIERRPTMRTHLFAALLCLVGCWPCACIPYCTDSCNNSDHYCPNCNAYIGSYVA